MFGVHGSQQHGLAARSHSSVHPFTVPLLCFPFFLMLFNMQVIPISTAFVFMCDHVLASSSSSKFCPDWAWYPSFFMVYKEACKHWWINYAQNCYGNTIWRFQYKKVMRICYLLWLHDLSHIAAGFPIYCLSQSCWITLSLQSIIKSSQKKTRGVLVVLYGVQYLCEL